MKKQMQGMRSHRYQNGDVLMVDKEKEYRRICEKLGFIPSEYEYDGPIAEDDAWVNPFSVLTIEESDFLLENGYLNKQ